MIAEKAERQAPPFLLVQPIDISAIVKFKVEAGNLRVAP
jgi:hypothetical protein